MASWSIALVLSASLLQVQVVDEWVPYPDGRPGGCYRTERGQLYSCTPPPQQEAPPVAATPSEAQQQELLDTKQELAEVRRELEKLKLRQAEDDARRAQEIAEREAAELAAREAEQREQDAAMQAFTEIEIAKDDVRRRELELRTETCRKPLEQRGYRIVGPGACRTRDGSYVNCPDC
jgi:hypothetical protein